MGTSTDTTAGVTLTNVRPIRWSWSASARYALRQPTRSDMTDVQTAAIGGSVERRFRRVLGLRASASYVRQLSGDPAFVGSAPVGVVGLVWNPRGRDIPRRA